MCLSPVGKAIGFEPVKVKCDTWLPAANQIENRPVEGQYLFREVPNVVIGNTLPPATLPPECRSQMQATQDEIKKSIMFK